MQLLSLDAVLAEFGRNGSVNLPLSRQLSLLAEVRRKRLKQLQRCAPALSIAECLPLFALRSRPMRLFCHCARFCPFCWARCTVKDLFVRTAAVLREHPDEFEVLTAVNDQLLPFDDAVLPDLVSQLAAALGDFRESLAVPAVGAYSSAVIEPDEGCWRVSRRLLLLLPAGSTGTLPAGNDNERYSCIAPTDCSELVLAKEIGRFAGYPRGLLSGDCRATAELLGVLLRGRGKNPRLSRTYGALRGRSGCQRSVARCQ